jgi:tRNA nucleotidyltransferase (CCA-adding enzyme)
LLVARFHGDIRRGRELRASTVVRLLESADALRRPQRFEQLLQACVCDFHGRLGWETKPLPDPDLFVRALGAARAVDAAGIARSCNETAQIPERLNAARVAAVKQALALLD